MSFVNVYVGFVGVFAFILGFSLLTGTILIAIGPAMKWLLYHLGGLPGKVAAGNIRQNLSRTSVAVSAFMVALALSIGLGSMIGSFRQSLVWWMGTQLRGDLYISTITETPVPEDFYEEIKSMPGLDGVDPYRNVQVMYNGSQISVSSIDASVLQRFTRFGWLRGGNENWEAVKHGAAIISESFSRRFGVKEGEAITLEGVNGAVKLPVQAIFYDYTTEHGLVIMDRSTYIKMFGDRTINSLGIFMNPDNPRRAELLAEVRRKAQERNLPVLTKEQLQGNILALFDSTFAVTRSMRLLAIIVAFFGITGALLTLFLERRRDFGIYRAFGFSTSQIGIMTVLEGLGMGLVSFLLSTVGGTALAIMLIKVINLRSFNWTIFYYPEWQPYVMTGIVAICASLGAAALPFMEGVQDVSADADKGGIDNVSRWETQTYSKPKSLLPLALPPPRFLPLQKIHLTIQFSNSALGSDMKIGLNATRSQALFRFISRVPKECSESRFAESVSWSARIHGLDLLRSYAISCSGFLALLFLVGATGEPVSAAGEWKQAIGPWQWSFPRDHGAHPEYRTEWWYFTGNLKDKDGKQYGYQLTFFRQGLAFIASQPDNPWSIRDVYLAHFALVDGSSGKFWYHDRATRTGPGLPVLGQAPWMCGPSTGRQK